MKIINARVCCEDFKFREVPVCTDGPLFSAASADGKTLDARGFYALPGLVDIHFHGCAGADFMDGTREALAQISRHEAACGVTSICPATMTMPEEAILRACACAAAFRTPPDGAALEGINLEGPFVSPQKAGAQNPEFVIPPSVEFIERVQAAAGGLIKLLAIAPEVPGALDTIRALKGKVLCSIAHTTASYETAAAAIAAGATHLTHLYNAMPPLLHRAPGPVAAGADAPWCEAEIICDGIHIHPAAVRAALRLYGEERLIFISDSIRATGLDDGSYELGGQQVRVQGRRATLANGTLAGSVSSLFDCLKTAIMTMDIPPETALRCASLNPARALGAEERIGSISPGKRADLLLTSEDLELKAVMLRGRWLFLTI